MKLTGYRKDGRKAATGSPEVGRLPAVQARRNKLYGTAINIVAQIELEVLLDVIDPQAPLEDQVRKLRTVMIRNNKQHVTDMQGKPVFSVTAPNITWTNSTSSLDVSSLAAGLYLVWIDGGSARYTFRFVKL